MKKLVCSLGLAFPGVAGAQVADHLVLTEVAYDPADETAPSAEFLEIFNPTAGAIPLDEVYVSDAEADYFEVVNGVVTLGTSTDFVHRFPAGASLPAGGVAVVVTDSAAFLAEFFPAGGLADFQALSGSPQVFETTQDGAGDGVADMIARSQSGGTPITSVNFANGGECLTLFQWDQASDLVQDLDHVCWENVTSIIDKDGDAGFGIDGPDPGAVVTPYLDDAGTGTEVDAPDGTISVHRATLHEVDETLAGGNGAGGHDESTEDWSVTWTAEDPSPGTFEDCRGIDAFCGYGAWNAADDACDPAAAQPDGTECPDADLCDGVEVCEAAVCVDAPDPTCPADANLCDTEECDPGTGECSHVAVVDGTSCADLDLCDGAEECAAGVCPAAGAVPVVCDPPANPCLVSACVAETGLCAESDAPDGTECDDDTEPCVGSAECTAGVCGEAACEDAGPDSDTDTDTDTDTGSDTGSGTDTGSDTDTGDPLPPAKKDDGGCGCRAAGSGSAWVGAAAFAIVFVRRRRRA
jgi:MYXO-CTERM domain-containing protein